MLGSINDEGKKRKIWMNYFNQAECLDVLASLSELLKWLIMWFLCTHISRKLLSEFTWSSLRGKSIVDHLSKCTHFHLVLSQLSAEMSLSIYLFVHAYRYSIAWGSGSLTSLGSRITEFDQVFHAAQHLWAAIRSFCQDVSHSISKPHDPSTYE